jgi:hypothetical protein
MEPGELGQVCRRGLRQDARARRPHPAIAKRFEDRHQRIPGDVEVKAPPPSKDLCLLMAKITYPRDEKLSWTWLFAWGFHEMYVDGWYEDWKP